METINDRIQNIVNVYYRGNESEFARDIGVGQSTLNGILGTRKNNPSSDTIGKILSATVVKISSDWLMTGNGEMEKKENVFTANTVSGEAEQRHLRIKMLEERIEELKKENKELTEIAAVLRYQLEKEPK